MNWNLIWKPIDAYTSEFIVFLGDEPIITKKMFADIIRTPKNLYLTFVESSYKFSFELFNEFICEFESGKQTKFVFDINDGEEAFAYDSDMESLKIVFQLYSSNLNISIPMDERTRMQFANEFRKFLTHNMNLYEESTKLITDDSSYQTEISPI